MKKLNKNKLESDGIGLLQHTDKFLSISSNFLGDWLFKHIGVDSGIELDIDVPLDSELLIVDQLFLVGFVFALLVLQVDFHAAQVDMASVVNGRFLVFDAPR